MIRLGHFLERHRSLTGRLHPLFHKRRDEGACWVCRAMWAPLIADPTFQANMLEALDDYKAGRFYHRDITGGWVPNKGWPADGPQPHVDVT